VKVLGAKDEEGDFHWTPMREILTRGEANELIDTLEELERRIPQP